MQLKIQRSQRTGGVLANTVLFCLDIRADYSPEERNDINKYKLGGQVIYNSQAARRHMEKADAHLGRVDSASFKEKAAGLARGAFSAAMAKMSLNVSIASLGRGHHIECKDLQELLEAEDTLRTACKDVTRYLEAAATFNGSETVIEYDKGEEKIHITQSAPPLLTYSSPDSPSSKPYETDVSHQSPAYDVGKSVGAFWSNPRNRKFTYIGAGIIVLIFLFHSLF